ncbi:hypothetical protein [Mesorhizobium sp. M1A.F.Ca.ET.072.01.1.1]|uniref:hypothetical protein n=1 Tax=Mesorhizobium sp. M1A.F.Ca.ET.072.01.1.1 TaxID=2496753 RepID=UPI0016788A11|nr:hypothetical protein [Mesorhizobium sp. M1A.F.Ca.ET.072.01.1.1]
MRTGKIITKRPDPKRKDSRAVLAARPRSGPIDYAAFTGRVIKRFPKVIAELAK